MRVRGDRREGVRLDVVLRALLRQRVDQANEAELGRAVIGLTEVAEQGRWSRWRRRCGRSSARGSGARLRGSRCSRRRGAPSAPSPSFSNGILWKVPSRRMPALGKPRPSILPNSSSAVLMMFSAPSDSATES